MEVFSFQELRRDIQAVIGTRANINIAQIEDYGGEIFLSEEITVYILQEAKEAFKRCQLVCKKIHFNYVLICYVAEITYLFIYFFISAVKFKRFAFKCNADF